MTEPRRATTTQDLAADLGEPTVEVLADAPTLAAEAAHRVARTLTAAVERNGVAHWATTGGSSAVGIYEALARPPLRDAVPWDRIHTWWGDERFVPRDHPLSNARQADQLLLRADAFSGESGTGVSGVDVEDGSQPGVIVPAENVHPWPCTETLAEGGTAATCAGRYVAEVGRLLPLVDGWPAFDLVILGVGPDGHILSVFPDSPAIGSLDIALGIPAPTHVEPHVERVTFNPRILDTAAGVMVVTAGAGKSALLADVLGAPREPRRWPVQLARRTGATWLLDRAAASALSPNP
ncbi:MAG TPA: 6-phosphogluconolactonase [Candidatus Limnocylindrales bacterium]